jgi:hypothetical protein
VRSWEAEERGCKWSSPGRDARDGPPRGLPDPQPLTQSGPSPPSPPTPTPTPCPAPLHRYYAPRLAGKTLTKKLHGEVAAAFVERFGPRAGWAHSVLFISDLRQTQALMAGAK